MRLIDFSAGLIPPDQIKAAGYDGVVCYVSESRPGTNFGAKPITRDYADRLRAVGLHVVSNFQYGKAGESTPSDYTRGYAGGAADAQTALRLHEAAGGPPTAPIMFSVDEDIDLNTWNGVAVEWFHGINSVLGVDRTGIYGHSRVCAWAIEDAVVGRSTTPERHWVWQTRAWSCGQTEPAAVLYQDVIDTVSNPGPLVGGVHVDVSEVRADDFGQWGLDRSTQPVAITPNFRESTEIRSPYCGSRGDVDVSWFVLHTEDGYSNGARNLACYLSDNDKEVSYHYTVDNDGNVYNIVDTDNYANAAKQPGNSKSINLAFAGSWTKWSRKTWFDRMQHGIDVAAYIAARDTRRYRLQPRVISPEEAKHQTGITDHNGVRIATGVGDHTDVGPGFPWDYFSQKLSGFAGQTATVRATPAVSGPAYPGSVVTLGATGPHVIEVQNRLNTVAEAGLLPDGEYAPLTRRAVSAFQKTRGLQANGEVGPATWNALFSDHPAAALTSGPPRTPAAAVSRGAPAPRSLPVTKIAPAAEVIPGGRAFAGPPNAAVFAPPNAAVFPPPLPPWCREVTGRGLTTSVRMEAADLGIMRRDPDRGTIAAMFGDNFTRAGDWRQGHEAPSIVMFDDDYRVKGIPAANFQTLPDQCRQQMFYRDGYPGCDTVLPCDFIKIGDTWTVAVMLSKGELNQGCAQFATEFWQSRDLVSWYRTKLRFDHRSDHPGNTMLTFDRIGDWVYIFGTGGLERDKGIWMWRNPANAFPMGLWEPWGYDETRDPPWNWGIPNEYTPILNEGGYGELCFRYIQGNCVLSYLIHKWPNGRDRWLMEARTVSSPDHDWLNGANVVEYASDEQIPNLYGGYISPSSRLNEDGGMHFWVSQWPGPPAEEPYRVILVRSRLNAVGPLVCEPPLLAAEMLPQAGTRGPQIAAEEVSDTFPLPYGGYWGPSGGPDACWSNLSESTPQSSKDGLARWQQAIGIEGSGVFDNATKEAAAHLQCAMGQMPSLLSARRGVVGENEWNAVIRDGWRLPAPQPPSANPAGYEIGWYPGPGYTRGHGAYLRIYLHTTESQDWITPAETAAQNQARTESDKGVSSYHFLVDDDHIINTVATKNIAWGVHRDNPVSVQIAMVCTSGTIGCWNAGGDAEANPNSESQPKNRDQWLAHTKMLDMVAFTIATVATDYGIPLEWVDVDGIGANRPGVSSHHNYSYGSEDLHGVKDSSHWDVPPTFPSDHVLDLAREHCRILQDPNRFPLPKGHYWGPLHGPQECWSNTHGGEPRSSKDGLARWQTLSGVPASGCYGKATHEAAVRLQQMRGWRVTGCVSEREWSDVIGDENRREARRAITVGTIPGEKTPAKKVAAKKVAAKKVIP